LEGAEEGLNQYVSKEIIANEKADQVRMKRMIKRDTDGLILEKE
jgi:hypothetical protein